MTKVQKGIIFSLGDRLSGFIRRVGFKEHLFFHSDDLKGIDFGQLKKGDKVNFSVVETSKGPYAIEVKKS